jgi:AmmeMemoRadiSam system protein B
VRVRQPAVAGTFYPDDPVVLREQVDEFVGVAGVVGGGHDGAPPKALVVPHAGYVYSGPIAGRGYAALAALRGTIRRVVLLGPAHRVPLDGLAVPSVDGFETPLGTVAIDTEARDRALACDGVVVDDLPHAPEHSLEVHLPFLQRVFGDGVSVLPIVVGHAPAAMVAAVLDAVWGHRPVALRGVRTGPGARSSHR